MRRNKFFRGKTGRLNCKRFAIVGIAIALFILASTIVLRLIVARQQAPTPQAMLVLEGNTDRVLFAAEFSQQHSSLPIWVSGNRRGLARNQAIFATAGVPSGQVSYDFCATDTVTNFTCNVEAMTSRNFQHVYLITSDYHMRRSLAIAAFVFGSQGIFVTPISVESTGHPPESIFRLLRDCIRSIVWIVTGWTGVERGSILLEFLRD
ncbi:YdcF family protein [Pseudanabaenaceae cyanobacterium LEGE 13415]|nr:YdcF family protein [Pseudanabaenaceae cyanobacterium LEGE 13415]